MNSKINLEFAAHGLGFSRSEQVVDFVETLPAEFKIRRFGYSDILRELHEFNGRSDPAYKNFMALNPHGPLTLRLNKYTLNYFGKNPMPLGGSDISIFGNAQKFDGKLKLMNEAWEYFLPDGRAFYQCHTGYAAKAGDPRYGGQADAEDVNRFNMIIHYRRYDRETGEEYSPGGRDVDFLRHLDLLPGLVWRIAMGEHLFQKFDISPEEISRVCVSTEETRAANGDKLWKFQTREDPLDWRDSYERQLRLDRPDVSFDITPLRERFAEPVELADRGMGDDLDKLIKHTLKELYPERATRGIL